MVEIDSRKAALIAEIEVSRSEMRGALRRCEADLNPAEVVRRSVRTHSGAWLSSAVLLGLALSQVVRIRSRRSSEERLEARREDWLEPAGVGTRTRPLGGGWMLSLGRLAFDLLKPIIADWAAERLSSLARAKVFTGNPQTRNGVRSGGWKPEADRGQRQSQDS